MAGIIPTLQNIGILIAALYPLFIVSFLVLASAFNYKLNGLIYLLGILILFGICFVIANLPIGEVRNRDVNLSCDFFSTFGYNYLSPSFQVAITCFTLVYLAIPMLQNITLFNPMVFLTTLTLSIINALYLWSKECSSTSGIIFGGIIGFVWASVWYTIISTKNKDLLFYNELVSNNVVCNKPSQQTFKCRVYKNGELISSTVTG